MTQPHSPAPPRAWHRPSAFERFDGDIAAAVAATPDGPDFVTIQASPEFRALRRRVRLFVFSLSALFFCWYMTYVLFAAYDRDFMNQRIHGQITVGLVFGLLQFVSTILITVAYARYSRKRIDPSVDAIRARAGMEAE